MLVLFLFLFVLKSQRGTIGNYKETWLEDCNTTSVEKLFVKALLTTYFEWRHVKIYAKYTMCIFHRKPRYNIGLPAK